MNFKIKLINNYPSNTMPIAVNSYLKSGWKEGDGFSQKSKEGQFFMQRSEGGLSIPSPHAPPPSVNCDIVISYIHGEFLILD